MHQGQEPNWQPISMLPTIAYMVEEAVEGSADMLASLQEALRRTNVLTAEDLERVLCQFTEARFYVGVYDQQLSRWEKSDPDEDELEEIERLQELLPIARKQIDDLLECARKLKKQ